MKPWEKYQQQNAQSDGPWTKYQSVNPANSVPKGRNIKDIPESEFQPKNVLLEAGKGILEDLNMPARHFANQYSMNALRSAANTAGKPLDFEATSPIMKAASGAAGIAGAVMSPVNKVAILGAGGRVIPRVLAGAASGALYSPDENILDGEARLKQAAVGGAFSAAAPVAGRAFSAIPKVADKVAKNMYNNIVRLPSSAVKFGKDPLSVFSKEKIVANSTDDFATKAQERLNQRSQELEGAIQNSTHTIDAEAVVNQHLTSAANKSTGSLKDRTSGIKELEFLRDSILQKYGNLKNLTVQQAIKLKRQLADDFPFIAEDPNNINTKAAHKIYHDLNELVEQAHPEIKDLNQRVSGLIDITNAARNRAMVESRNNPFSVLDTAIGGFGWAASGNPLTGAALVAARKALGSPAVQTRVAAALSSLPKGQLNKIVTNNPWLAGYAGKSVPSNSTVHQAQVVSPPRPQAPLGLPKPIPAYLQERQNMPNRITVPTGSAENLNPISQGFERPVGLPAPNKPLPSYLQERQNAPIESLGVKGDPTYNPGSKTPIPTRSARRQATVNQDNPNIQRVEPKDSYKRRAEAEIDFTGSSRRSLEDKAKDFKSAERFVEDVAGKNPSKEEVSKLTRLWEKENGEVKKTIIPKSKPKTRIKSNKELARD